VPWEMRAMLGKTVVPELRRRAGEGAIVSREILVMGLGESHTHQLIADIVDAQTNPTIAYLAGAGRVRVRLTAKAASDAAALGLIKPVEEQLRERLGDAAVEGEGGDLAEILGDELRQRGMTVATCESLTGGEVAAQISGSGGSSDFFVGGLVTYATGSKAEVAGVDRAILEGPGAVSEEAAAAMAAAAASSFDADLGLSTTGVAGPAEQEGKPVGTIFIGAALAGRTEVRKVRGYGDRANIRATAANAVMDLGRRLLRSEEG
jgi:nicotinamide-nucleotide amidase